MAPLNIFDYQSLTNEHKLVKYFTSSINKLNILIFILKKFKNILTPFLNKLFTKHTKTIF